MKPLFPSTASSLPPAAQNVVRIPDTPVCPTCRILVDTIAVLGEVEGPGTVQAQTRISRAADGRYFLISPFEPGVIKVFGPDGRYRLTIGRHGAGPGEYRSPWLVLDEDGGSTHIFDARQARATALDTLWRVIQTKPFPVRAVHTVVRVGPTRFVLATQVNTPDRVGLPLHMYDFERGSLTRSFGTLGAAQRTVGREDMNLMRYAASGTAGTIWSAHLMRYRVERWDTAGRLLSVWERNPRWFPPFDGVLRSILTHPPHTQLLAVSQDRDGRLWTLSLRAAPNWRPPRTVQPNPGMSYIPGDEEHAIYESVIEVLAERAGSAGLFASRALPGRIAGFAAPGILYRYEEDSVGNPRYLILRVRLVS